MKTGCEYCRGSKPLTMTEYAYNEELPVLNIQVTNNGLSAYYSAYSADSSFDGFVAINYCPMCGRKFDAEKLL